MSLATEWILKNWLMGLDHEKVVPISFSNRFLDENTLGICYEASEKKKRISELCERQSEA